jgi:hypothetical protein
LELGGHFGRPSGLTGVDGGHQCFVVNGRVFKGDVAITRTGSFVVIEQVTGQGKLRFQFLTLRLGGLSRSIGLAKVANEVSFGE